MSSPSQRYVPVHKRSPSASSTASNTFALSYSRDELLALAPSASHVSADSTTPSEHHYSHHQPHEGWAALNKAMRDYLRVSCPEIAMNRKMRKSIEYQHYQNRSVARAPGHSPRAHSPQQHSPAHSRSSSPTSSTSSDESHQSVHHVRSQATQTESPIAVSSAPVNTIKRVAPRRSQPTATRERHNNFTAFHKQLSHVNGELNDWRRGPSALIVASH